MLEQFSDVVLSLWRGAQEVPMASFQEWALEYLQTVINFDSAVWLTAGILHSQDSATFHMRHFFKQPSQLLDDWMKCKGATTFPRKMLSASGEAFICTPSTDMPSDVAKHCQHYSIEQILSIVQPEPVTGLFELISFYRRDIDRPFSENERFFQQNLAPHLSEVWRTCRARHLGQLSQSTCKINLFATAAADRQGVLHLIDPSFTNLLREEWPNWEGPWLPVELLDAYFRGELRHDGKSSAFFFASVGDNMLLRGRRKLPVDCLSRREREVATHFAHGSSFKEVAQKCDLSPATVRNYLSAVYRKLGVNSKAELATIIVTLDN